MKLSNIFYHSTMSIFSTLALSMVSYEVFQQYTLYKAGAELCSENGYESASPELIEIAYRALAAMDVKKIPFITFYKAQNGSSTASWQMWLDTTECGPTEFVIFHEAAHMALGHFDTRVTSWVTYEMAKAQEIEADLLACKTLFELGRSDVILQRIATIKKAIAEQWQEYDSEDHPSLREIYKTLIYFARSKGLIN